MYLSRHNAIDRPCWDNLNCISVQRVQITHISHLFSSLPLHFPVFLSSRSVLVLFMEPIRKSGVDADTYDKRADRGRIAGNEPWLSAVGEQERRRDTR